ncbi:hypothetical protein IKH83_02990 [Candidatus Saccharibacteria bacterium]|nr:hypothetical protein [Candidatus Saccharibacteria bacterium]
MEKETDKNSQPKTTARVGRFAVIGTILALFNFTLYTTLARLVFKDNSLLWVDSIISCTTTTILAFILHSKITWKERPVSKHGIAMFFVWNGITSFLISPLLTWSFGFATFLYEFAFSIASAIHLPFDYAFVESTGVFVLTAAVTMVLNYLFYDRLVFGDRDQKKSTDV